MAAGTIIPPRAAITGSVARRTEASSPTSNSRLISRPTTKKNTTIRPSFTQWDNGFASPNPPMPMTMGVCHSESYSDVHGELAHARAMAVAARSRRPPAASRCVNS